MIGDVASRSEGPGLRPSPMRFVLGLLLFAATWNLGLIPLDVVSTWGLFPSMPQLIPRGEPFWLATLNFCLTYFSPPNTGWLCFWPGMVGALIFFGCLRFWLRRQRNGGGWLRSACVVSITLAALENALLLFFCNGNIVSGWTRDTLSFVVSLTGGLFVSGVLSACCWAMPSRRPLTLAPPAA